MADWRRCAQCGYMRHVNDDGHSRRDTCPRCGAVYAKAERALEIEKRARSLSRMQQLLAMQCRNCGEIISTFAYQCSNCKTSLRTKRPAFAIAAGLVGIAAVAFVMFNSGEEPLVSPFPGLSDGSFQNCIALSESWLNAESKYGTTASETLQAQNKWHKSCSRKALREVANRTKQRLPTTPNEWLDSQHQS